MDSSRSLWIDFRNQRWDFHVVHSFHGKIKQMGNYFGIVNTILSGTIDYILGNKAAIITYPVTFLIYTFAIKKWEASARRQTQSNKPKTGKLAAIIISIIAFLFAFVTNYIGYGGKDESPCLRDNYCLCTVPHCQCFNALKLTTQWGFWLIYNFVQLTKLAFKETLPISENTSLYPQGNRSFICLE